jgi:1-acyl-sn-glycerol-3-phosphate acyltransferase
MEPLRVVRSFVAFVITLLVFLPLSIIQRVVVWPGIHLRPAQRWQIVSWFMKLASRWLLWGVRLGGARWHFTDRIPTTDPVIILSNHQSLLDILVITLMGDPFVPAFVTRARYGRYIPTVSLCVRLLDAPLIDPRDRAESLRVMQAHAQRAHHGFIVFPEGHRSRDGQVLPFKRSGTEVLLKARRVPVWLVVHDGFWVCPTLWDFIFRMHRIDARTEVLGPFSAPAEDEKLGEFVQQMRRHVVERLDRMRAVSRAA